MGQKQSYYVASTVWYNTGEAERERDREREADRAVKVLVHMGSGLLYEPSFSLAFCLWICHLKHVAGFPCVLAQ